MARCSTGLGGFRPDGRPKSRCHRSALPGRKRCARCTETTRRGNRKARRIQKEAGRCAAHACPNLPAPGRRSCERHLAMYRRACHRLTEARYLAGRCARCPKPAAKGRTLCPYHLKDARDRMRKMFRRRERLERAWRQEAER